ncbi:MAG: trypsin-like peptidase domain-containing protein [Erysipelotrichaceae bacterium]|nr:trypsin-like peptidase domain-containing protein [Erysipelotrichaceae bacterium]
MEENNVFTPQEIVQEETEQTETIHSEPKSEFTYESEPNKEPVKPKKTGTFKKIVTGFLSMILIPSAVGFGSGIAAYKLMDRNNDKVILQTSQSQNITTGTNSELVGTKVAEVAAAVKDTVVEITTEYVATSSFFSNYVTTGAGSGVIFTNDGYIVTNNHVIEGSNAIQVTLNNGDVYAATLIATDSKTDLAVIKIEASGLTAAILGDSDALVVGEDAIAIGNPLGELGGTVTNGIISALDREVSVEGQKMNLLQTNAAINPGNSGGGLFNAKGELIGIVSAKSSGEDIEGLGFAIPVNDVKEVVVQLIEKGYVAGRPALGVSVIDINSIQLAMQYGVSQYGVYIVEVLEGSAAEKAGLQSGDMFIAMNDIIIESYEDLSNALSAQAVGDTVVFQIKRNGRMIQVEATLQENTNPKQ